MRIICGTTRQFSISLVNQPSLPKNLREMAFQRWRCLPNRTSTAPFGGEQGTVD